ncbi:Major allergen Pru av 1 [Vitis vinifera]|uniref:Major allergen Pru av 1 n=1 Tax=Vitis vinifera TaxID=29760 RepID=A0A438DXF7_VITVI|nr:Major allergen Pru av 1 [Vitis vinifera]
MGVISYEHEIISSIPPAKIFKAFILDSDNLIPKVLPQAIKCVEIIEGDGGPGSIKKITFGEGSQFNYVKHRVDGIDKENFTYSYSLIEGDALMAPLNQFLMRSSWWLLPMEDPSARALASTIPKVTLRSQKTKLRLAKRRLWACSRLLKPTSWPILMPIK